VTLTGVELASQKTPNGSGRSAGYTLEIAFPWVNLPGFSPAEKAVLGVDFAVNDADGDYAEGAGMKSKLVWHGVEKNYETTRYYGLLQLTR
jgi:hypothetical protein